MFEALGRDAPANEDVPAAVDALLAEFDGPGRRAAMYVRTPPFRVRET